MHASHNDQDTAVARGQLPQVAEPLGLELAVEPFVDSLRMKCQETRIHGLRKLQTVNHWTFQKYQSLTITNVLIIYLYIYIYICIYCIITLYHMVSYSFRFYHILTTVVKYI